MHIVDSPLNTVDYAKEVQPHLFISVPRIYEKVYSNLMAAIESKAILKVGLMIPGLSNVFKSKLKAAAGFSNVRFAISGAAPINPDILSLFQKLGIPLFEGYGMTENTAGASMNYVGNNKIGSVGKAFPGTELFSDIINNRTNLLTYDDLLDYQHVWPTITDNDLTHEQVRIKNILEEEDIFDLSKTLKYNITHLKSISEYSIEELCEVMASAYIQFYFRQEYLDRFSLSEDLFISNRKAS